MAHLAFLSFVVIMCFGDGNQLVTRIAVIPVFSRVYLRNAYHFISPVVVCFELATGVTFLTNVWFFSQVSSFMHVEFVGLSKRLVAYITGVSFDATVARCIIGVHAFVFNEVAGKTKRLVTYVAGVGFVVGVG